MTRNLNSGPNLVTAIWLTWAVTTIAVMCLISPQHEQYPPHPRFKPEIP